MILDKLLVMDASKKDAGRGLVRIDPSVEGRLGLKSGDVLEIINPSNGKRTAADLYSGSIEDTATNIIRIDSSLRRNIDIAINDIVEIRKIDAVLANEITFAGLEQTVIIKNSQSLAKKLENRIITKDDILSFYAMGRRIDLIIFDYKPKAEAVRIHKNTKIIFSEKSYKEFLN